MQYKGVILAGAAAAASLGAPAMAQHEGDVLVEFQAGRLVTGNETRMPYGLFMGVFGDPIPGATTEPGFEAEPGALPPGTPVGLTVRRALRRWESGSFGPGAGWALTINTTSGTLVTPAQDPVTCQGPALVLGVSNSTGGLHLHPGYILGAGTPDGVYLLEAEVWLGAAGQAASEPFAIVFSQNAGAAVLGDAIGWAESRYALPCEANCDASTAPPILNVGDFTCFLQKFAAGDCSANCDRSTAAPALNVADFTCFLQRFAVGCGV
jgi:hypothetical protein